MCFVRSGAFAIEQLSEALSSSARSNKISDGLPQKAVRECANQLAENYDPKYGGFGSAPKFPRPVEIELMLYHSKMLAGEGKSDEAMKVQKMVMHTLEGMAKGGIHDHCMRDILDYLRRDMIGPTGEIFSAEDADSLEI
nr:spermatogenesis-associated protein 20 isoform X2 [Ipomoea batatas]